MSRYKTKRYEPIEHESNSLTVIYARVSSKEQKEEGYSIEAQLRSLRDYAQKKGLKVDQEFIDIETAKVSGRKQFSEMMSFLSQLDLPSSQRHKILVEKTDRLTRNLRDFVILDEMDVEIHLVKENEIISRDSTSHSKFVFGIKTLMAKNYTDNLSEESRKGTLEKARLGIYPGRAPIGYKNTIQDGKKIIEKDAKTASLVPYIFETYLIGDYSTRELAKKLRAEGLGLGFPRGRISKSGLHKMLANPMYYGQFRFKGQLYHGKHEPLISKELFDRVQDKMAVRTNHSAKKKRNSWAFQGLVRCGHCDGIMSAEIKKGKYIYYHCTGAKHKCPGKYAREEILAEEFAKIISAIKIDDTILRLITETLRKSLRDKKEFYHQHLAQLQKRYETLQNRIDKMYIDKLDGLISEADYAQKSLEWRNEQAEVMGKIEEFRKADESYLENGANLLELAQKAVKTYEKQEMKEKRRLINFVISNSIWKDGRLSSEYRKPFDLLVVTNNRTKALAPGPDRKNLEFEKWMGLAYRIRTTRCN